MPVLNLTITGRDAGAWLREAGALIEAQQGHPRGRSMAERIEQLARLGGLFQVSWASGSISIVGTVRARELMLEMRGWPDAAS